MLTDDCATEELLDEIFREGTNFASLLDYVKKRLHKKITQRRAMNPSPNASFLSTRASGGQRTELIARSMGLLQWSTSKSKSGELPERGFQYLEGTKLCVQPDPPLPIPSLPFTPEDLDSMLPYDGEYDNFGPRFDMSLICQDESELCSMHFLPSALVGGNIKWNTLVEVRTTSEFWDVEKMLFSETEKSLQDDHFFDHTLCGKPYALCAPILEPLKIRMVSAGPARLYASLKSYQKDIHSVMRKIPLFRLIGRPQSPTDLSDLISTSGNSDIRYLREPNWLSADYASATDHLSSSLSRRIHEYLLGDHPGLHADASRALGSHRVVYPPVEISDFILTDCSDQNNLPPGTDMCWTERCEKVTVDPVTQRNGQLMGSIVSFPILCLANAAALDLYQRREFLGYSLGEYLRSALINGDDLVTVVDGKDQLLRFKEISASLGLDLTIGKSYIDSTYANINSAAFHYNLTALQAYLRERFPYQEAGEEETPEFPISHLVYQHLPGAVNQHLPVPRGIDYFNYGLYSEKHKVQDRVGGESENLDVLDTDPEFSTELFDPNHYSYSNLPPGAHRLLQRLRKRFEKPEAGEQLSIPKEGDRPFWAVANRIASGTPPWARSKLESELHKRIYLKGEDIFLYQQSGDKAGKWRWGRRNHRLPISAGGLGLFPDSQERYYVTNLQRALAKGLRDSLLSTGCELNTQLPKRGPSPKGKPMRHPFAPRVQRVVEIPSVQIESNQTWRFKPTPLIPSGGPPIVV
jgi:hypothetical protein